MAGCHRGVIRVFLISRSDARRDDLPSRVGHLLSYASEPPERRGDRPYFAATVTWIVAVTEVARWIGTGKVPSALSGSVSILRRSTA